MSRPVFNASVMVLLHVFVLRYPIHISAGSSNIVAKNRDCEIYIEFGRVKVKATLELAMKAQKWSKSIALILL